MTNQTRSDVTLTKGILNSVAGSLTLLQHIYFLNVGSTSEAVQVLPGRTGTDPTTNQGSSGSPITPGRLLRLTITSSYLHIVFCLLVIDLTDVDGLAEIHETTTGDAALAKNPQPGDSFIQGEASICRRIRTSDSISTYTSSIYTITYLDCNNNMSGPKERTRSMKKERMAEEEANKRKDRRSVSGVQRPQTVYRRSRQHGH